MNPKDWLNGLKVGDSVTLTIRPWARTGEETHQATVGRVTSREIVVDGRRLSRATGRGPLGNGAPERDEISISPWVAS